MAKKMVYKIANRRRGSIIIPRFQKGLVSSVQQTQPIIIPGGQAIDIDGAEWEDLKKNRGIQNYVDAGILEEVKKVGEVPIMMERTSNPPVPEHLQRDEEIAQNTTIPVKASVRRKNRKEITI